MSGPAGSLPALQVHPSRRCNLRCLHCYSDSGPDVAEALEERLVLRVVVDAARLGYRVLSVSGGEPLLYEPLPRLLRAAHEHGLITTVTSNGMLLDERHLALLEPDTDLLALSLDGVPESHAEMRASSRAFDELAGRLSGLRAAGIPFGFIVTLTFHNVHELDWAARFAVEQGAALLQIHPLEPVGRAGVSLQESVPDAEELACALVEVARLREAWAGRLDIQLDVATVTAVEEHPEKIFADADVPGDGASIADVLAPLVLETSGVVAPLQYGFPRAWCLGNVQHAPLEALADRWRSTRLPAFRALCRAVRGEILAHPEVPVLNWYVAVHRAATCTAPALPEPAAF